MNALDLFSGWCKSICCKLGSQVWSDGSETGITSLPGLSWVLSLSPLATWAPDSPHGLIGPHTWRVPIGIIKTLQPELNAFGRPAAVYQLLQDKTPNSIPFNPERGFSRPHIHQRQIFGFTTSTSACGQSRMSRVPHTLIVLGTTLGTIPDLLPASKALAHGLASVGIRIVTVY